MTDTNTKSIVQGRQQQRVVFFDNLRSFFVLGVVIQHVSMAYNWSDWWPVTDEGTIAAGLITALMDGFLMPALFYIAGYFAIPSIRGKKVSEFIAGKLKRLGIPWLVCILFVCPVLPFIYHFARSGFRVTIGYWELWQKVMSHALEFNIGILPPMNQVMQNDLFYQRYMWFIALLIAFFLIFALLYRLTPGWFRIRGQSTESKDATAISTVKLIFGVGASTFLGSTIIIGTMFFLTTGISDPESWFTLGNLVQFRVSRIFLHIFFFGLGIVTYKNDWIHRGILPGHMGTWLVTAFVATVCYLASLVAMQIGMGDLEQLFGLVFWFCLNFYTIAALGLAISLGVKFWNRKTPLNRKLAASSYNIYLSHYLIVFTLQLLFALYVPIPSLLKLTAVSLLSILGAYLVSRFVIKPFPKSTILAVAALFFMALFIHP